MKPILLLSSAALLFTSCEREETVPPTAPEVPGKQVRTTDRKTPGERLDEALQKTGEGLQVAGEKTEEGLATAREKTEVGLKAAKEKTEAGLSTAAEKTGRFLQEVGEKIEEEAKRAGDGEP